MLCSLASDICESSPSGVLRTEQRIRVATLAVCVVGISWWLMILSAPSCDVFHSGWNGYVDVRRSYGTLYLCRVRKAGRLSAWAHFLVFPLSFSSVEEQSVENDEVVDGAERPWNWSWFGAVPSRQK